jgi:hypothetical protein
MNPIKDFEKLTKAITMPFQAIFVVGLCGFINWFTSPGAWWVQWVAFGMGIAVLCAWADALKVVFKIGLAAALGYIAYRFFKRGKPSPDASAA